MKDLTQGSIARHLVEMSLVMLIGMMGQTLYYLVDLYFVAKLGPAAVAGVGAAGNIAFIVLGLTQILGVGTVALIAHAAGRRDQSDANLVFNQAIALSIVAAFGVLFAGYCFADAYMGTLGADATPRTLAQPICTSSCRDSHCSSAWLRWDRHCVAQGW